MCFNENEPYEYGSNVIRKKLIEQLDGIELDDLIMDNLINEIYYNSYRLVHLFQRDDFTYGIKIGEIVHSLCLSQHFFQFDNDLDKENFYNDYDRVRDGIDNVLIKKDFDDMDFPDEGSFIMVTNVNTELVTNGKVPDEVYSVFVDMVSNNPDSMVHLIRK